VLGIGLEVIVIPTLSILSITLTWSFFFSTNIYWVLTVHQVLCQSPGICRETEKGQSLQNTTNWQERQSRDRQWPLSVVGALRGDRAPSRNEEAASVQPGGNAIEAPSSHTTGLLRCLTSCLTPEPSKTFLQRGLQELLQWTPTLPLLWYTCPSLTSVPEIITNMLKNGASWNMNISILSKITLKIKGLADYFYYKS
jgi:hypothetical protein